MSICMVILTLDIFYYSELGADIILLGLLKKMPSCCEDMLVKGMYWGWISDVLVMLLMLGL